jgi:hypothetical protein
MIEAASKSVHLGVHVAAGVAYFGAADAEMLHVSDPLEKIEPTGQLPAAARLRDFRDRFAQELHRLAPASVGVIRTTRFSRWTFAEAWDRFSLEAVMLLAASNERVPSQHVVAEDAARTVPCLPKDIAARAAQAWGVTKTRYWKQRAPAFAAALALARGEARCVAVPAGAAATRARAASSPARRRFMRSPDLVDALHRMRDSA